jgi:hypothetical protein
LGARSRSELCGLGRAGAIEGRIELQRLTHQLLAGCVGGVCVAPKVEGAACGSHAECRAQCLTEDGGAAGTCAKQCPSFALPTRVAPGRVQEK